MRKDKLKRELNKISSVLLAVTLFAVCMLPVQSKEISSGNAIDLPVSSETVSSGNGEIIDNTISGNDIISKEPVASITEDPYITQAKQALSVLVSERTIMALVYLSDEYPIRYNPSNDSEIVATVPSGQQVQILDVYVDSAFGTVWEYVSFYYQGSQYHGYIPRKNLACSDEKFLAWEDEYNMNPPSMMRMAFAMVQMETTSPDIEQFPESYKAALYAMKEAHPNWTFVKMNTGLDWNTVVENEIVGARSLIPASYPVYMQNGIYSPGWAYASKDALKYYLDPRNGLVENYIFQFEQLTYNASYHTEAALQTFLNGTFMESVLQPDPVYPSYGVTYARVLFATGEYYNVSPFHLACRLRQEQGNGTSPLISGTYPGYEGLYNYFNIGASGSTNKAVIESGLAKAREKGWTSRYKSIYEGAEFVASSYINKGQDTVYLQKFDVDSSYSGLYWHQYMQNICAPFSEGQNIKKIYSNAGSLENTFVFKIPVYNNMPENACPKPTVSNDISLTPPEGYTDNHIYLDGVDYEATLNGGNYIVTAPDQTAKTAVMYKYNENHVPVGMYVWTLSHDGKSYTATAVPGITDLLTYHGFSIRIMGASGIRFKTGISQSLRNQLTTTGVGGYTLKEYGTLVMNHANMSQYPFVLGGQKVKSVISYGKNTDGQHVDTVYETVNGRYRYTAVLIGLPASQYKTEFAFRGYLILTKGGSDIVIYGPPVWKSIYSLSEQVIASGQYETGSFADQFLHQIITDADANPIQ
ncbi:MAG TPA: hypothetical protein VJY54_10580 [Lachnospiraceae bacterium]|nr:hypothetical protein [Lachnospiraceae bacterium]